MSVAFLFPGQGSQAPGFLHRLPSHPAVEETLRTASDVLEVDVRDLDTPAALASTVAVQLTAVVAGVAVARALAADGTAPDAVAGLSVGAFTAAVAAGALPFDDALRVVRRRGELMRDAFPRGHGLAAVVGLDEARISALLEGSATPSGRAYLANVNAPAQMVIAGPDEALDAVLDRARAAGAVRAERLAVAVPSHTPLLSPVAAALADLLREVPMSAPRVPCVGSRRARLTQDPDEVRSDLAGNVMYPVRWHDATTALFERGVRLFVELHPGRTLATLAAAAFPEARAVATEDTALRTVRVLAARERLLEAQR